MDTEKLKEELNKLSFENLMECVQKYASSEKPNVKNLRKFHNWVKLTMLINITKTLKSNFKTISLLDIAVGRGGDIHKWDIAGIKNVMGFDKSFDSVKEANNRYNSYLKEKGTKKVNATLTTGDATFPLGSSPEIDQSKPSFVENIFQKIQEYVTKNKINGFEIVSCQFAIHYFFRDEVSIRNALNLVSAWLVEGGYFIGTTFNSKFLIELLKKYPKKEIHEDLFTLVKHFDKINKSGYGNGYTFYFNEEDTGTYFSELEDKDTLSEYVVDFKLLEKLALEYNLKVSKIKPFNIKSNSFEEVYPLWRSHNKMLTPQEQEISFLNSFFVFEKF